MHNKYLGVIRAYFTPSSLNSCNSKLGCTMEEASNECSKENAFVPQVNNERELDALNIHLLEFPSEQKFWIGLIKVIKKYKAIITYNSNMTTGLYYCIIIPC